MLSISRLRLPLLWLARKASFRLKSVQYRLVRGNIGVFLQSCDNLLELELDGLRLVQLCIYHFLHGLSKRVVHLRHLVHARFR